MSTVTLPPHHVATLRDLLLQVKAVLHVLDHALTPTGWHCDDLRALTHTVARLERDAEPVVRTIMEAAVARRLRALETRNKEAALVEGLARAREREAQQQEEKRARLEREAERLAKKLAQVQATLSASEASAEATPAAVPRAEWRQWSASYSSPGRPRETDVEGSSVSAVH